MEDKIQPQMFGLSLSGLVESIYAAAAARIGKTVLHIDRLASVHLFLSLLNVYGLHILL